MYKKIPGDNKIERIYLNTNNIKLASKDSAPIVPRSDFNSKGTFNYTKDGVKYTSGIAFKEDFVSLIVSSVQFLIEDRGLESKRMELPIKGCETRA